MAEVEWVQTSTGFVQTGADDLFKSGSGYVPVCWIEYKGTIYRSTLPSLRDALLRYSSCDVKLVKDSSTNTVRSLTVIHGDNERNIEAITDLINYWYNASIKSEYADIMEIAYTEPLKLA